MRAALRIRLPSVASDEVVGSQRLVADEVDVDASVVLGEAAHLASAVDRHVQLGDPAGQDRLERALPQRKPVIVARGEVADVEGDHGEPLHLHRLARCKEAVSDAALVEHLDGAGVQSATA